MWSFFTAQSIRTLPRAKFYIRSLLTRLEYIVQRQWLSATLLGFLAVGGSAFVGFITGIPEPIGDDEFSYLLAADTFAHGRVTNPTHPMWVHFEGSHAIHQPTYMSKYPPGQGLALAAGQVLAGHPIVGVWMSFGLMCAAICWMLYSWMPPRWAVLGGVLTLINPLLGISGYWAQSYWGGAVAATGGALVFGAARRIIQRPRVYYSFLLGMGLAILANSRPYEGLLVSLPSVGMLLFWMLSQRGPRLRTSVARIIAPLLTVLALTGTAMGFYNLRITGSVFRMPYQVYEETYDIAPKFIWRSLRPEPIYHHQVLHDISHGVDLTLYKLERSVIGFVTKNVAYLSWWVFYSLNVFLIPLIAMFSVTVHWASHNRWGRFALLTYGFLLCGLLLAAVSALGFFGLLVEIPMMIHYAAPIISFNYFFVLQAMRLWKWRNGGRQLTRLMLWLIPFFGAAAIVVLLYSRTNFDDPSVWYKQRSGVLEQLKQAEGKHLIIVSYGSGHLVHEEWVHNKAEIDSEKVIWARDMDASQNCSLVGYFRDRHIWSLEVDKDDSTSKLEPYVTNVCR